MNQNGIIKKCFGRNYHGSLKNAFILQKQQCSFANNSPLYLGLNTTSRSYPHFCKQHHVGNNVTWKDGMQKKSYLFVHNSSKQDWSGKKSLGGIIRGQQRNIFIQFFETPNPASLKFFPEGKSVLGEEGKTMSFDSTLKAYCSPLAKSILSIDGVKSVMLASDFITVTIEDADEWVVLKPQIFHVITNHYQQGKPVFIEDAKAPEDTAISAEDDEVVIAIKEILESKVRPLVQEDGGDVEFRKFEDGVVFLRMTGSCETCPSSTATLKMGIENMLMHYVPEVQEVRQELSEAEEESQKQFEKVEQEIGNN